MLGLTTVFGVLLRKCKTNVAPNLRERLDTMADAASYEALLHKLKGKEEDGVNSWELFLELYEANQKLGATYYFFYFVDFQIS